MRTTDWPSSSGKYTASNLVNHFNQCLHTCPCIYVTYRECESSIRSLNEDKHTAFNTITSLKSKLVKCQEDLIEAHGQLSEVNVQFANKVDDHATEVTSHHRHGAQAGGDNSADSSFNYDEY